MVLQLLSIDAFVLYTMPYLSVLLLMWIVSEAYLQWINYKGRFRYRLLEGNKWQRSLQNRIGVFSLAVSFLVKFGPVLSLPALVVATFRLSIDIAFISVVSGFLALSFTNASFDNSLLKPLRDTASDVATRQSVAYFWTRIVNWNFSNTELEWQFNLMMKQLHNNWLWISNNLTRANY